MPLWKVLIDYDASLPLDQHDAIDTELDRLAADSGEVVDSGSGTGFGRRDLDYAYETETEATKLVAAVQAAFASQPELDLTIRAVEVDEAPDEA